MEAEGNLKHEDVEINRDGYEDPSSAMWSIYLEMTDKYDKIHVERWKGDCDGILIFTGLFSATVAAFTIESYKTLQPDPQDISVVFLAQIASQISALSNGTVASTPISLPPFKPSESALRVNIFWFLSLVISISCALAAIMIQQWSRRYLALTQRHPTPKRRARARAFFHAGVKKYHLSSASKFVPALLHGSVFLFFAGLIQFAFTINSTLAWVISAAVAVVCCVYSILTITPMISLNAPYFTPLSTTLWTVLQSAYAIVLIIVYLISNIISPFSPFTFRAMNASLRVRERLEHGIIAGQSNIKPDYDLAALSWLSVRLVDDSDMMSFVKAILGFLHNPQDSWAAKALFSAIKENGLGIRIGRLLVSSAAGNGLAEPSRVVRALACLDAVWHVCVACDRFALDVHAFDPKRLALSAIRLLRDDDPVPAVRVAAHCATAARVLPLLCSVRSAADGTTREVIVSFVPSPVTQACAAYNGIEDLPTLALPRRRMVTETLLSLAHDLATAPRLVSGHAWAILATAVGTVAARRDNSAAAGQEKEAYESVLKSVAKITSELLLYSSAAAGSRPG